MVKKSLNTLKNRLHGRLTQPSRLLTATQLYTGRALQVARRVMRPFVDEIRIDARLIDARLRQHLITPVPKAQRKYELQRLTI